MVQSQGEEFAFGPKEFGETLFGMTKFS